MLLHIAAMGGTISRSPPRLLASPCHPETPPHEPLPSASLLPSGRVGRVQQGLEHATRVAARVATSHAMSDAGAAPASPSGGGSLHGVGAAGRQQAAAAGRRQEAAATGLREEARAVGRQEVQQVVVLSDVASEACQPVLRHLARLWLQRSPPVSPATIPVVFADDGEGDAVWAAGGGGSVAGQDWREGDGGVGEAGGSLHVAQTSWLARCVAG